LHPAALTAVRQIVNDITNLLSIAGGHVEIAMTATREHPVNRKEELALSREASDLAMRLAHQLAQLLGPGFVIDKNGNGGSSI
jgi:hypothetical protein